ncbi:MAG: poly-beta-1,6 N-acetyl-D-glucosamine export porin PgaA, partial [Burkholderiaceae bacterium]
MLSLSMAIGMLSAMPAHAAAQDEQYDALIIEARNGNYDPALVMLRHRVSMNREDTRAIIDLIVIAGRAGRNEEVTEVYESLAVSLPLPAEALATVARAYRDEQKWNQALAVYRKGAEPYPADETFVLGETMVLADAGQTAQAVALGRQQVARTPRSADRHLALSYAYAQDGQPFAALAESDLAYAIAPKRAYVARAYVFALQRARMPEAALRVAGQTPGLLTEAQLRRIEGDAVAEQVRMSGLPSRNERERLFVAQRALDTLDGQIAGWQALGEPAWGDVVRARIDRLHVLYVLSRMSDVIAEYESLRHERVDVPRYALNDVAGAYLYVRQPERAAEIYRSVGEDPQAAKDDAADRLATETGLYYAQAESDQLTDAATTVSLAQGGYAPWLYYKGQQARMPNDLHLEVRQLSAQSQLTAGDTPAAQAAFDELVEQAPYNSGLLAGRADVLMARDQPRRAERELKLAETLSPRNLNVEVAQGYVALDLQEWRQAELLSNDVITRFPENLAARRLARAVEVHNKS